MGLVQLKESVIFGGAYYRFDTVIEEEKLPEMFRTPHYIKSPGPPAEDDWEEIPSGEETEPPDEDDEPRPRGAPPKRR